MTERTPPPGRLADLPALSYDELTCMLTALVTQARNDRDTLGQARGQGPRDLLAERLSVTRSLIVAVLEARVRTTRPSGGALEPLRLAWTDSDVGAVFGPIASTGGPGDRS